MKKYNLVNNTLGWLSFAIAAIVYLLTIEPTASFWDCGEFITSAFKLEVGHPPGAPFFMLTGKLFTLFAPDTSKVAIMVNAMSALLSAATIMFLFWTITHLTKKLVSTNENGNEMTFSQLFITMGSGLVGALAYTFSDTFWFSAVEGEVYAYSSMFTALVFWLILKWENRADENGSDKWLVLIAYTMGLSIGVHLLNLLCIPAIVLVYYFKKSKNVNLKGTLLALLGSMGLVVVLMYGVIPGFTKVGGWFELFFVNELSFSYNSGALIYLVSMLVSLIWALFETLSSKGNLTRAKIAFVFCMSLSGVTFIGGSWILWVLIIIGICIFCFITEKVTFRMINTSILCLFVILIGYSSFALIPIRSIANTPMDQNSPEDVFSLSNYLNREQYGDSPLLYGRTYASKVERDNQGNPKETSVKKKYDKIVKQSSDEKDKYFVAEESRTYDFTNTMLFPRMYSDNQDHIKGYKNWAGITSTDVPPTFLENIRYLFAYQINYMYWRYFMWNFSGRQNDIAGNGGISNGNWITGISFIDEHVLGLGPQDNMPDDIINNKGHNVYYMLPLILGIIGIFYQLTRGKKGERQFWITFMLFFMTGLAIILYLNQKPFEPRERDYAYAGSFYAFCIWIGMGVAGIWTLFKRFISEKILAPIITVLTLLIPIQMGSQNWDDHDRSNRYTMRDFGMNYLRSVAPNGIIFTNGDNDTFPLWYAQEVEGFRTDVRVTNLSYLQTDWYVDQMRRQAYESEPLPIDWDKSKYIGDKGQFAYLITKDQIDYTLKQKFAQELKENPYASINTDLATYYDTSAFKDSLNLDELMTNLKSKDSYVPRNPFIPSAKGEQTLIIPSNKLYMPIDSSKIDWKTLGGMPTAGMTIDLGNKNALYRQELMILEMLNNINKDNWKRPIYFARTVGSDMYMNMRDQFSLEGLAYRITPGIVPTGVNTDVTFDNMMNKFKWGGVENPKVYLDENNMRMTKTFRITFAELIYALIEEGKNDKALEALEYCLKVIPGNTVPFTEESSMLVDAYYKLNKPEEAKALADQIAKRARKSLNWYNRLNSNQMNGEIYSIIDNFNILLRLAIIDQKAGQTDRYKEEMDELRKYSSSYYKNNVAQLGNYGLENLADVAIRGYYSHGEEDTTSTSFLVDQDLVQEALKTMNQYSPELLKKYMGQSSK